jgi:hypothetical protein
MFDVRLTEENKPVIIYLGNKVIDIRVYVLNPWDLIRDECITHRFYNENDWVVYTLDSKNKSKLIIKTEDKNYEFILPITIDNIRSTKIICSGLNKTGTTSLSKSLRDMGLRQFPEYIGHQFLTHSVIHGSYGDIIKSIENIDYDFYEDMPFSFPEVYKGIFNYFPNEKYILTVRNNSDEWVESCIKFYKDALKIEKIKNFNNTSPYEHNYSGMGNYYVYNWGHPMFKMWGIKSDRNLKNELKRIYESHNENFINFMDKNKGDYIVINVSNKGELKKLSEWLGIENSKEEFEHLNKTI